MPSSTLPEVTNLLCRNHSSYCISRCVSGVLLPEAAHVVELYHTGGSSVRYHQDKTCSSLQGKSVSVTQRRYVECERQLCSRCRQIPEKVLAYRKEASSFARVAKVILNADAARLGRISPAQAEPVAKAKASLERKRWSAELAPLAERLGLLAAELVQAADETWSPDPVSHEVLRAAAVVLLGSRTGERPGLPEDEAAAELWPEEALESVWSEYLRAVSNGQELSGKMGYSMEAFPGRRESATALLKAWQREVAALVSTPGPDHLVVIPAEVRTRNVTGSWVVESLVENALCPLPKPLQGGVRGVLVVVPELVVRLLARSPIHGVADLGTAIPLEDKATLETALTLWTTNSISDLRRAFELASLVV